LACQFGSTVDECRSSPVFCAFGAYVSCWIGIPADEIGHVFEEFFRATNARKIEKDGTGLGLSIARHIVERHGGQISVESEEGRGTKFTLSLPKRRQS